MSLLVRLLGFPGTLIAGDPLVWDRWRWLKPCLQRHSGALLDVGCGSGAFSIGAACMGFRTLGLSWDERNQFVAGERAGLCKAAGARFQVLDVRKLDTRTDLREQFDVVICLENIEHILDDKKLMTDMAACLKSGGSLLLTTPNKRYRPIGPNPDDGPLSTVEDGGHVRRGYTEDELVELCRHAGLMADRITYCSGFLSQKLACVLRILSTIHYLVGWAAILPFRWLPLFDPVVTPLLHWPGYSICLEARKPQ
jgi:2-polyprenyl-3-methyl-5-hydroxy-6-metoxy-1,4-benzoquinol methylase